MIKICVAGSRGRMGKRIMELAHLARGMEIVSDFDMDGNAEESMASADVVIDFTLPAGTISHLAAARELGKAMVIGTTGLTPEQGAAIKEASKDIAIVFAPNMSIGMNLLFKLVSDSARILKDEYKIEMTEAHHIHKKDKPSGTAKHLADIAAGARGVEAASIPIKAIREGEIVGDHEVVFKSVNETITLRHSAASRDTFAAGALQAARFIAGKGNGLYDMQDVLEVK